MRKPPLNIVGGKILTIIFNDDKGLFYYDNPVEVREEMETLFTFKNVFKYRIYKIKKWIWRIFYEKNGITGSH